MKKKFTKLRVPNGGHEQGRKMLKTTVNDQKEMERNLTQAIFKLTKICESLSAMTIVNQSVHYHNAGSISIENIEKMGAPHGKE